MIYYDKTLHWITRVTLTNKGVEFVSFAYLSFLIIFMNFFIIFSNTHVTHTLDFFNIG